MLSVNIFSRVCDNSKHLQAKFSSFNGCKCEVNSHTVLKQFPFVAELLKKVKSLT